MAWTMDPALRETSGARTACPQMASLPASLGGFAGHSSIFWVFAGFPNQPTRQIANPPFFPERAKHFDGSLRGMSVFGHASSLRAATWAAWGVTIGVDTFF